MQSNKSRAVTLREKYRSCIKWADRTDSKSKDKYLRGLAAETHTQLVAECPHDEIIIMCSSYEGSYSYDYEDGHAEERLCLCCGLKEIGHQWASPRPDTFGTLTGEPIARFEWRLYRNDDKVPIEIRDPLSYSLEEVVAIARREGYRVLR